MRDAVAAATAQDREAFAESLRSLSRLDREQLQTLLGTAVQALIEQRHPDGLDAGDVEALVDSTLREASWYPAADRDQLLRVLVGALGLTEIDDDERRVDPQAVLAHGILLLSSQVRGVGELRRLLDHGLRELHRAQTQEMP